MGSFSSANHMKQNNVRSNKKFPLKTLYTVHTYYCVEYLAEAIKLICGRFRIMAQRLGFFFPFLLIRIY